MDEMERLQHDLYSRTNAFRRKLDVAQCAINEGLAAMGSTPYVSFSGGIDSTVLLDLLFSQDVRLPVLWGDDGADFPVTLQFLSDTQARYGFHLIRIRSMAPWRAWCQEMSRPDLSDDPEARDAWLNPRIWNDTWHTLTRDAPAHGYTGVFMGMLAAESRARSYVLHQGRRTLYQVKGEGGMWHCSPLAGWSKREVWAYAVSKGLAYNPVYDRLAELHIPLAYRRVAAMTCYRVLQWGSHAGQFRYIDSDLSNRLCTLFPRLRAFS